MIHMHEHGRTGFYAAQTGVGLGAANRSRYDPVNVRATAWWRIQGREPPN
jgi:hypothetical protein